MHPYRILIALLLLAALTFAAAAQDPTAPAQPVEPAQPAQPAQPADNDDPFTNEAIRQLLVEVQPLVEKAIGEPFNQRPPIRIGTADEVAKILTEELGPQIPLLAPHLDATSAKAMAAQQAAMLARGMLGKFAPKTGMIYIVAENFASMANVLQRPEIRSRAYLRATVIHEAAHAHDQQVSKLFDRIAGCKNSEELEVLNAVAEGHAQFVLRRVLDSEQNAKLFTAYEAVVTATPPGLDDVQKLMARMLMSSMMFAYVDGRLFFDALEREDGTAHPRFQQDVLAKLPANKRVISRPYLYYHPDRTPTTRDLDPVFKAFEKQWNTWRTQRFELAASQIRTAFGDFVAADRVDRSMKTMDSYKGMVLQPAMGDGNTMITLGIAELDSVAAAREFYDLQMDLVKTKDERLKQGQIAIENPEYFDLGTDKADVHIGGTKTVVVNGIQRIPTHHAFAAIGRVVIELQFTNQPQTDAAALKKYLELVLDALKAGDRQTGSDW